MLAFTAVVSPEQVGKELSRDSEDASYALVEFAQGADLAELIDELEQRLEYADAHVKDKVLKLAETLAKALGRVDKTAGGL